MADLTPESRAAFLEDVSEFAAGRLSEERAAALLAAARQDPVIMQALRSEEALDKLLEHYEYPELPEGLAKRFWERFQQEKFEQEPLTGRSYWWVKLVAPIAAAILIAVGLIYLPPGETPVENKPIVGGNESPEDPDIVPDDDSVLSQLIVPENEPRPEDLKPEQLKMLKAMDDARMEPLGNLQDAEDARLVDTFETLNQLEPHKEQ